MKYYVSVTGLKVKHFWLFPKFYRHALPSFMQAQSAPGNLFAETSSRNGIQHTLTVWEDRQSMLKFLRSGAHGQAMKITKEVSDLSQTKVYGYESDTMPTWDEALALWEEHGKLYGEMSTKISGSNANSSIVKSALLLSILAIVLAGGARALIVS